MTWILIRVTRVPVQITAWAALSLAAVVALTVLGSTGAWSPALLIGALAYTAVVCVATSLHRVNPLAVLASSVLIALTVASGTALRVLALLGGAR